MFTPPFAYAAPDSLSGVLSLLDEHGEEGKVLSGGQSLVPLLKLRLVRPAIIIDVNHVPGLDRVTDDGTHITVGGLVRHHQMRTDPLITTYFPWLCDMVPLIGDPQVRSLGTLAGTLVEADPAGDWSAAMIALDAEICAVSSTGRRVIPIAEWFVYSYTPALADNEFVEGVRLPKPRGAVGGCYVKLEKRAGDFAIAGCAASVERDPQTGTINARVGLIGLGSAPLCCPAAGAALSKPELVSAKANGQDPLAVAKEAVQAVINPMDDSRGSASYKRELAGVVLERAVAGAVAHIAADRSGTNGRGSP